MNYLGKQLWYCSLIITIASISQIASSQGYWWQAPQLKYAHIMDEDSHGTSPHYWTFGGPSTEDSTNDQTYLYTQDSGMNAKFSQYVVQELRDAESGEEVTHRWNTIHLGRPKGCSQFGNSLVIGNGAEQNQPFFSYPDDYTLSDRFEAILEADISPDADPIRFSHDGAYLYTNNYTGSFSRSAMLRYRVEGPLDEDGVPFILDTDWGDNGVYMTSVGRLRNFTVKYIGGKNLVYFGEGATANNPSSVYVIDAETQTEHKLVDWAFEPGEVNDADIVNIKIAGVAEGNPHLYVCANIGGIQIYQLASDGLSVLNGGEPVRVISTNELNEITGGDAFSSHFRAFEVTDDQQYAFLSCHNANDTIFVINSAEETAVEGWSQR